MRLKLKTSTKVELHLFGKRTILSPVLVLNRTCATVAGLEAIRLAFKILFSAETCFLRFADQINKKYAVEPRQI